MAAELFVRDAAARSGSASVGKQGFSRMKTHVMPAPGASPTGDPSAVTRRYRQIILASDAACAAIAAATAYLIRFGPQLHWHYVIGSALFPLLWIAFVGINRGYERRFLGAGSEEVRCLTDATLILFTLTVAVSFISKSELSRAYVMMVLPLVLLLSLVGRRLWRRWLYARRVQGAGQQRVLVVGRADAVTHVVDQFEREPWHGLRVVGACVPHLSGHDISALSAKMPVVEETDEILSVVDTLSVDVVAVVSHPDLSGATLRRLGWALDERDVDLMVSPGIVDVAGPRLSIRPVAGLSLLHLEHPEISGGRMMFKSVLDRILAIALLLLAAPLLGIIWLSVRLTSPGPAVFRQTRIGLNGREFEILKFRSMVVDAEARRADLLELNESDGNLFKIRNDPRITRVGALIRRFSLDELPQLWNVVRGEMSLVGPRPPLPEEVARYDFDAVRRLRVRPGLTGLWQVSGRSDLSWDEALRLDLRYVDNWTLWLDASILWRTGRAVLSKSGAY